MRQREGETFCQLPKIYTGPKNCQKIGENLIEGMCLKTQIIQNKPNYQKKIEIEMVFEIFLDILDILNVRKWWGYWIF